MRLEKFKSLLLGFPKAADAYKLVLSTTQWEDTRRELVAHFGEIETQKAFDGYVVAGSNLDNNTAVFFCLDGTVHFASSV